MKHNVFSADITDAELLAYLEGDADDVLAAQIEQSETLSLRAQQLRCDVNWLTAYTFRRTCPDPDELGDFHLGLLSKAKARAVKHHVLCCPFCSRELVHYRAFLGDAPEQPGPVKRMTILLAELLDAALSLGQMPAPAYALRGEDIVMLYHAGDLQIAFDVQEDVEKPGYKSVVGLITGPDASLLRVDLWQEGGHLDTVSVDEMGGFMLQGLLPGGYELIIKGEDVIIHLPSFSF